MMQRKYTIGSMGNPSRKFVSTRQRDLFEAISHCGDLIFACGPKGVSVNYFGIVTVASYDDEDRLEMGDGTFHVHLDWRRIQSIEVELIEMEGRKEGVINFVDGSERLFRLFRQTGAFPETVAEFAKSQLT